MPEHAHNRLVHEKSPYLLQHAHNPVDWRPWGEAAFEEAQRLDKPIFLSIGYSTCHWCHVMERESFEDEEVAAAMNAAFVPIKVDREERPDVDAVYMTTCQLMTGKGGWPLSIVMTPDKRPFFAATYIPKDNRYGSMGLLGLCKRIADIWASRRQDVDASADKVADILGAMDRRKEGAPAQELSEALLEAGFRELLGRFDKVHGGFGTAPKFPSPHVLLFLLRFHRRNGHPAALDMVEKSLEAMRLGGMYDHVGFGFHRYSTDQEFLLPHFEKMLYDQAMLLMACAETWQAGGKDLFATTAREVVEYLLRDMTHSEGGFYCAEDADSEGEEGKFYVWSWEEWKNALGDEAEPMARLFTILPEGNFADESTGERIAANIPHLMAPLEKVARNKAAQDAGLELPALAARVEAARMRLFGTREKRVRPHKDDKILADWNGLMIAALAKTARTFRSDAAFAEKCEQAAARAAEFVLSRLGQPDGSLLHRWRDGEAKVTGHLDDYACMIWGLVELHQASLDSRWLAEAEKLAGIMLARFRDEKSGGLYLTADSSEKLLYRPKEVYDGAAPSGNSVAAFALVKLARLTARADLEDAAAKILTAFALDMSMNPSAHCMLLCALDFVLGPSWKVMLSGDPESPGMAAFIETALAGYSPDTLLSLAPAGLSPEPGELMAQACKDVHCLPPAGTPDILAEQLAGRRDA